MAQHVARPADLRDVPGPLVGRRQLRQATRDRVRDDDSATVPAVLRLQCRRRHRHHVGLARTVRGPCGGTAGDDPVAQLTEGHPGQQVVDLDDDRHPPVLQDPGALQQLRRLGQLQHDDIGTLVVHVDDHGVRTAAHRGREALGDGDRDPDGRLGDRPRRLLHPVVAQPGVLGLADEDVHDRA